MTLLTVSQVSRQIGHLSALHRLSFTLESGEIIGLVGRRGAGKSTLLHILAGLIQPTAGEITWEGQPLHLTTPRQASQLGIELVHQQPLLVSRLDVTQNIFLGREQGWRQWLGIPNWKEMTHTAQELLEQLEAPAGLLQRRTEELSDEERQLVAFARVLHRPGKLVLLDDALSALSFHRQEIILNLIMKLAGRGTSFMIGSENLKHLFAVTDRLLVLYEGHLMADCQTDEVNPREVVELIVGASHNEQVTPIIWALENYHHAQQQAEELRLKQTSLQESLEAQGSLNRQLVDRLQNQVKALDELNVALQAAQRRLLTEREQERKHLAREIHDAVIQDLLSFNYQLEELEEAEEPSPGRQAEIQEVRGGIRRVISDLRQICSDLRPPALDNHGLLSAIRSHAQEWATRHHIQLELQVNLAQERLPEPIELSIFRIVQEGLNNISKHAQASQVWLTVEQTPAAGLLLRLIDNGVGVNEQANLASLSAQKHFGLLGISERVALLGGSMSLSEAAGGGTLLYIEIPNVAPSW